MNAATDESPVARVNKRRRITQTLHIHPESPNSSPMASLDGLPVELKVAILANLPDVSTLHALVRSSPFYHQSYLGHRQSILFAVLSTEMTPSVCSKPDMFFLRRRSSEETRSRLGFRMLKLS